MIKPTIIHLALAAVMLRRGWMKRYLPAIVTDNVSQGVVTGSGYAWAALMLFLGVANLIIAVTFEVKVWAWFISFGAIGAKLTLLALQYGLFRTLVVRQLRASRDQPPLHGPDATLNDRSLGSLQRILIIVLSVLAVATSGAVAGKAISFSPVGPAATPGAVVPGSIPAILSLPANAQGRVPAVVIAHASAGLTIEGPESDYMEALNAAGIATLVIDMWTPRGVPSGPAAFGGDGGSDRRLRSVRDTLPDAFGALKYLTAHPAIDRQRIGIMGFSWGAMLSVLAMVEPAAERALGPGLRFAAHSGHYVVCSVFAPGAPAASAMDAPWTRAPLQLHVGGQDDYDGADDGASCRKLIEGLPSDKRAQVELIAYPNATHAWEEKLPVPVSFRDPRAQTGSVRITHDAAGSARARSETVKFFQSAFGL